MPVDLPEPVIFHDHLCGVFPHLRLLLEKVENERGPTFDPLLTTIDGNVHRSLSLSLMLLCQYRVFGQQSFVVGPRLQKMFERTSLEGVPGDMLKVPFPAFYIALPGCPWKVWGGDTGWHDVSGVLVHYNAKNNSFTLFIWGAENEKARVAGDDASFWINIDLNEAEQMGLDVETYLLTIMGDVDRDFSDFTVVKDQNHREIVNQVEDTAINVARVVFNLLIYLQTKSPERSSVQHYVDQKVKRKEIEKAIQRIKSPKKRKRKGKHLLRELERLSDATVTWIGESIERAPTGGHTRQPGQKQIRHWVRGHWWPRLDNTEAIKRWGIRWKEPFEKNKGCDEAEPSRHYKFHEEKTP